jgi:hypothetical protein
MSGARAPVAGARMAAGGLRLRVDTGRGAAAGGSVGGGSVGGEDALNLSQTVHSPDRMGGQAGGITLTEKGRS